MVVVVVVVVMTVARLELGVQNTFVAVPHMLGMRTSSTQNRRAAD
jgi:hypothetical protein